MLHTSGHVTRDTAETPGLCLILFTWSETLPLNVQAWMSSSNQFDCKSMKKLTNDRAAALLTIRRYSDFQNKLVNQNISGCSAPPCPAVSALLHTVL